MLTAQQRKLCAMQSQLDQLEADIGDKLDKFTRLVAQDGAAAVHRLAGDEQFYRAVECLAGVVRLRELTERQQGLVDQERRGDG